MAEKKLTVAPEVQAFLDANLPKIRPEGTIGRVRRAFGIDSAFCASFRSLRNALGWEIDRWPEVIVLEIMQHRDLSAQLDHAQMDSFRWLFRRHRQAILDARFDDAYFTTLEALVLFFIHHDIRAVWLSGAMKRAIAESMIHLYERGDYSQRSVVLTMLDFMALELSQVQRVYIRFAECQEHALRDPQGRGTRST